MKELSSKEAMSKLKPELCVFVLSVDENDKPNGMIAGWFVKCSFNPPLVGVCLKSNKNTQKLIRHSKEFVIAVANNDLVKEVRLFGNISGANVDKFEKSKIETIESKYLKTPLLKQATFNYECKLVKEVEVGDHIMFIGEILIAYHNENKKVLLNMKKFDGIRYFEEF